MTMLMLTMKLDLTLAMSDMLKHKDASAEKVGSVEAARVYFGLILSDSTASLRVGCRLYNLNYLTPC